MRKPVFAAVSTVFFAFSLWAWPQQESLGEAARRAREQKKSQPKPTKVFTNDNLPTAGTVSVIGSAPAAPATDTASAKAETAGEKTAATDEKAPKEKRGEAYWRKRFAELHGQLRTAEKELDILQRELNLQQVQYYSDPNKALREQYDRKDIVNHTKAIEDKKQEIAKLKRTISDLEDELRHSGGDPGWARE